MSPRSDRLLRWYPAAWRARYGAELAALLEDSYGGGRVPLRQRLSLAGHGLHERARDSGLADAADAGQRARSGALVVLCAWPAFVVAGGAFAKYTEHWDAVTPTAARSLPAAAYDAVVVAAVVGVAILAVGAILALPAFVSFLRARRGAELRAHAGVAAVLTAVTLAMAVAAVLWAHGQSSTQRNTTSVLGLGLGGLWVLSLIATLTAWCALVVAAVRRLELPARVVRAEGVLAVALVGVMAVVTAGTVTWWAAMATSAPRFLAGGLLGSWGPGVAPELVGTGLVMVGGLAAALGGARRVAAALSSLAG